MLVDATHRTPRSPKLHIASVEAYFEVIRKFGEAILRIILQNMEAGGLYSSAIFLQYLAPSEFTVIFCSD